MRILHVSDIHSASAAFKRVIEKEKFDVLVVTGDFERLKDVEPLKHVKVPVIAVHGNFYEGPDVLEALEPFDIGGRVLDIAGWKWVGVGFGQEVPDVEHSDKLIFVTHEPPFGAGDLSWVGPVGNREFRKAAQRLKPQFWLCGHIHEGRGVFDIGKTVVVNAGSIAEKSYAMIDTESKKVTMKILR
ncbi:MAG: metallophosphoesterase family protein [Candidatus Aenigmatarchaeota archaeon]